jgi:hypothetical protein
MGVVLEHHFPLLEPLLKFFYATRTQDLMEAFPFEPNDFPPRSTDPTSE